VLRGVRVLDLSSLLPGPYATLLLAEMGADVIKVESRMGDLMRQAAPLVDGRSAYFQNLNRGKRSIGVDLAKTGGRALFLDLVRRSDVVVEGFRPGRAERMGIGSTAARAANARLVYCAISGYGQTGPDAGRAGHDVTYLARAGVLGLCGPAGGAPVIPPVQMADLAAGTLAATAVCAALYARERTGVGDVLDISMLETMVSWMGIHLAAYRAGAGAARGEMALSGRFPCYSVYRTADGGHVALAALEPLFWRDFCRAVDRADLVELQFGDDSVRRRVFAEVAALFAARTTAEWAAVIRAHDLPAEVVADLDAVLADEHLGARGPVEERSAIRCQRSIGTEHTAGTSGAADAAGRPGRPAPDLAAHTREVLAEVLDLDGPAIDNLLAAGAAFGPERGVRRRVVPETLL
jgi:alpha-methylacyl-CoA racemase